jgi:aspartate racemase
MPKHLAIVACSAEGAALCYRTFCEEASEFMGEHMHPEVSMHTYSLGEYMIPIRADHWEEVAEMMLKSVEKLAKIGAQFAVCPDNTNHGAMHLVRPRSPIPWLHIAEVVGEEMKSRGFKQAALLGTKYLMTNPIVYPESLKKLGLEYKIPDADDREKIDTIIFKELVYGVFKEESRKYFNEVIQKLKDQGCDCVILGCTEIPLLVDPNDCPLRTLDSTRLLARAAIKEALKD